MPQQHFPIHDMNIRALNVNNDIFIQIYTFRVQQRLTLHCKVHQTIKTYP